MAPVGLIRRHDRRWRRWPIRRMASVGIRGPPFRVARSIRNGSRCGARRGLNWVCHRCRRRDRRLDRLGSTDRPVAPGPALALATARVVMRVQRIESLFVVSTVILALRHRLAAQWPAAGWAGFHHDAGRVLGERHGGGDAQVLTGWFV